MSLSLRITISRALHRAGVVHGLVGHAGTHRPVADHRDHVALDAVELAATAMPSPAEIEVELCAAPNGSYSLSRAPGEARQPARLAQRADALAPAGQDLVRVGLVADVPDQPVVRRVEHVVQGHGQLDHAQPGAEMPAGHRDRVDRLLRAARPPAGAAARAARRRRSRGSWIWSSSGRRRSSDDRNSPAAAVHDLRLITKSNSSRQDRGAGRRRCQGWRDAPRAQLGQHAPRAPPRPSRPTNVALPAASSRPTSLPVARASPVAVEQVVLDLEGEARDRRHRPRSAAARRRRRPPEDRARLAGEARSAHRSSAAAGARCSASVELPAARPRGRSSGRRTCRAHRRPARARRPARSAAPASAAVVVAAPAPRRPGPAARRRPGSPSPRRRRGGRSAGRGAAPHRPSPAGRRGPGSSRGSARPRRRRAVAAARRDAEQLGAGDDQERPQALAAAQHGVAHRLVQPRLRPVPPAAAAGRARPRPPAATAAIACCERGRSLRPRTAAASALPSRSRVSFSTRSCTWRSLSAQCCSQRRAALVGLDRALEVELAALELLHDPLELGQRLLEAHAAPSALPRPAPRRRRTARAIRPRLLRQRLQVRHRRCAPGPPGHSRPRGPRRPGRRRGGRRGRTSSRVTQAKSSSTSAMLASGSAAWASKPAETRISSGRQRVDRRQHVALDHPPPGRAAGAGRQRPVEDVALDAALAGVAGAGIERRLVGRDVERVGVVPERGLGAVAVVDVEVEDREPRQLVHVPRLHGADRDIVEQAEAHGLHRLGMVAGRAHGAERGRRLAAQHRIDRGTGRTRRPQRRLARGWRDHGVGVDPHVSPFRHAARGYVTDRAPDGRGRSARATPRALRAAPARQSPPPRPPSGSPSGAPALPDGPDPDRARSR